MGAILMAISGIVGLITPLELLIKDILTLWEASNNSTGVNSTQLNNDASGAAIAAVDLIKQTSAQIELVRHTIQTNHPTVSTEQAT